MKKYFAFAKSGLGYGGYYGAGSTVEEAKANLRKAGGSLRGVKILQVDDPDASVDPVNGGIYHKRGTTVEEMKKCRREKYHRPGYICGVCLQAF